MPKPPSPLLTALASCLCLLTVFPRASASVEHLTARPSVQRALAHMAAIEPEILEEQIRITEIPAPPFMEEERAAYMAEKFREVGLRNVRLDGIGNVLGDFPGRRERPYLVVAAHLDTVFPPGTDVTVRRDGPILRAPGIADDGRGLAVLLSLARTLNELGLETEGSILFVADVGEEGLGDLRGVRHLFEHEIEGEADAFISIDLTGLDIVTQAVGSYRYRVTFRASGGHSWGAFGFPNPLHAAGRAIEKIARLQVPAQPKTTFNVGRIEGGTSVNSIPHTVWMEVDLRSISPAELDKLDRQFHQSIEAAVSEENAGSRGGPRMRADVERIGLRPAGQQSEDAEIVRIARAATIALGGTPQLVAASTDANLPLSLGIPAVTLGGGGRGTGMHSLEESFDTTDSHLGAQRALLTVLGLVGLAED